MEINKFAPVLIPTLNRFEHFSRCVETLAKCTHADKTDLFIALDYPLKESHWEGYRIINNYLNTLSGFHSITIIRREFNYGAFKNLFDAIDIIFDRFDVMILSEDDNVFSNDFLNFVNQGLDVYKNVENIFSVSGYNYPIIPANIQDDLAFAWQGFSAWGVGLWKHKWNNVQWDESVQRKELTTYLKNPFQVYKLFRVANHYIPNILGMMRSEGIFVDVYISYYLFKNGFYSVFPSLSRVRNTGHDGTGVNCGTIENNPFINQPIYNGNSNYSLSANISTSAYYSKGIYNYSKISAKQRLSTFIIWLKFILNEYFAKKAVKNI